MKKVRGRGGTSRYTVRLCEVEGKALRQEEGQRRRHRRLPGAGRQRDGGTGGCPVQAAEGRTQGGREAGRGGQGLIAESRAPN